MTRTLLSPSSMTSDSDYDDDFMDVNNSDDDSDMLDEASSMGDEDDVVDDSAFFEDKPQRKAYETEYTVKSVDALKKDEQKKIEQLQAILGQPTDAVATLCRYFRWNDEKLLPQYLDSPDKVLRAAGISATAEPGQLFLPANEVDPDFMCDICCNDDPSMETAAAACKHRFCRSCYEHYLTQKINEGESRRIECPQDKCNVIVSERIINLLVDDVHKAKYAKLLNRTYVDDNDFLRWCPAPDCEYAIECHIPSTSLTTTVPTVHCKCENAFCFGCGLPDHQPAICAIVKRWLKKCEDDSETANWISAHTKECTKCHSTIEKNGGCNHMTCRKCRHEFCWVCMGPWSEHGTSWYNCNRFDEKSSSEARESQTQSRQSLERYLHYYNRYANHEHSAKLDQDLYQKTEKKMEEMQQTSDLSWIEVQFLKKAVDVTVLCRTTLKWTYAFAFYLQKGNETALFEDNQRDLEMATEQLSELLESPLEREKIAQLRQSVLDKTTYVKQRREILLEDTAKGLLEGRWGFIVDVS